MKQKTDLFRLYFVHNIEDLYIPFYKVVKKISYDLEVNH